MLVAPAEVGAPVVPADLPPKRPPDAGAAVVVVVPLEGAVVVVAEEPAPVAAGLPKRPPVAGVEAVLAGWVVADPKSPPELGAVVVAVLLAVPVVVAVFPNNPPDAGAVEVAGVVDEAGAVVVAVVPPNNPPAGFPAGVAPKRDGVDAEADAVVPEAAAGLPTVSKSVIIPHNSSSGSTYSFLQTTHPPAAAKQA